MAASVLANGLASKSLVMADGDNANAVQMQAEILVSKGKAQAPEIAKILFNDMDGWGTCDSFGDNFSRITKYNVINVLKAYKKEHSNGLLHDIAREYELGGLDLNERISYIKKIKTMVLDFIKERNPNFDTNEISKKFDKELQEQSNAFGRMDVTNLEGIINSAIFDYDSKNIKNNENFSSDEVLKEFNSIKNDFQLVEIVSKINSDNVIDFINKNKYGEGNVANRFIERVIRSNDLTNQQKNETINTVLANITDSETKLNVIVNFLHAGIDGNFDLDYEEILKKVNPDEFEKCLYDFEEISMDCKEVNLARGERTSGRNFGHSLAARSPKNLMQAIINSNNNIPNDKKRKLLNLIVDKAFEIKDNGLTEEKRVKYFLDAKQIVRNYSFINGNNTDLLNILIRKMISPNITVYGSKENENKILEKYNYKL